MIFSVSVLYFFSVFVLFCSLSALWHSFLGCFCARLLVIKRAWGFILWQWHQAFWFCITHCTDEVLLSGTYAYVPPSCAHHCHVPMPMPTTPTSHTYTVVRWFAAHGECTVPRSRPRAAVGIAADFACGGRAGCRRPRMSAPSLTQKGKAGRAVAVAVAATEFAVRPSAAVPVAAAPHPPVVVTSSSPSPPLSLPCPRPVLPLFGVACWRCRDRRV